MHPFIEINGRRIGPGYPVYVVAEMSANHNHDFDRAVEIVRAAKEAGADAIKLQTYTPDTMTIDCDDEPFRIKGTIWQGRVLHDLYKEAFTPWEWQPKLKQVADEVGIDCFSTAFDSTAVDFLEKIGVGVHKIASFENTDLPLLRKVASTGKPAILSTGMATLAEIDESVCTLREAGCEQLLLLKCTSAYPAPPEAMHLRTMPHLADAFGVPVGLSDHTLGTAVPAAAVAVGACVVEKHFTLSRKDTGPDSAFSVEPQEMKEIVQSIRTVEKALGRVNYGLQEREVSSRIFRRSLFVVQDMKAGDPFTLDNVRSIRPGVGLHTRHLDDVIGRKASRNTPRGTPLSWTLIGGKTE
ncbi:MAG: pseudaminic acid synthase [Armatimonadetes bacterium CG2_30_59_28]|nr:pseudaminic acid synthase [Armatimonadota bacterium]OIO90088.1 MAG: pseudaminic acid synthase [Armatimonadetes bacterium CG2_30_59_28]PIU60551.1 MAG: pseudaminic acid synthase [Armatimonadetes bacterium CG07_land_8_20_14_0_80_59_28]PIX43270.1 MAG: pseudaminic acid synthase [Armatimonadetes bacterium CG_4_8_14_3_um_filter_58_9]PJB62356.1 MAG: pseudaminic acid synthase [Armatimonadetes bacterium CG_4_9_14_3_um_filter_58_7]